MANTQQNTLTFKQKVEADKHAKEKDKKRIQMNLDKQKQIIQKHQLKNNYVFYAFIFGLIGTLLLLWPAGLEIQANWWYSFLIIIFGSLGYTFAFKAKKANATFHHRYRVTLHPKLSKAGFILSVFSLIAGVFVFTFVLTLYI